MKARNATMQERAYWDNILGKYENLQRTFCKKLKQELREARYSGRDELCAKLEAACEKQAEILHSARHILGTIPRA